MLQIYISFPPSLLVSDNCFLLRIFSWICWGTKSWQDQFSPWPWIGMCCLIISFIQTLDRFFLKIVLSPLYGYVLVFKDVTFMTILPLLMYLLYNCITVLPLSIVTLVPNYHIAIFPLLTLLPLSIITFVIVVSIFTVIVFFYHWHSHCSCYHCSCYHCHSYSSPWGEQD